MGKGLSTGNTYQDREIDRMFKEIQETLGRIEAQTMKTNGRVSDLEVWKSRINGSVAILSVLVVPVVIVLATLIIEGYFKK